MNTTLLSARRTPPVSVYRCSARETKPVEEELDFERAVGDHSPTMCSVRVLYVQSFAAQQQGLLVV